ncbi:cell division control protein 42 [Mycena alexandri]|uniref:Cell division control protein 42 n=1 Tax=Mycena alexandri TaxID=1745969 RepID=A0AAD6SCI9_9AGAR|nr:cell division control protein 42 [Mycena alexandri]
MDAIKLVLVGDSGVVGESSFSYFCSKMQQIWAETITVGTETYSLELWDTASQPEYHRLRPLSYPRTDAFLICFSVGSPASFDNIKETWYPELQHHCPDLPFLLVATKIDLGDPSIKNAASGVGERLVTTAQGVELAEKLGAEKYLECSAKTHQGLKNIFDEGIATAVKYKTSVARKRTTKCIVV